MDLTRQLQGREIAEVVSNGTVVALRMKDGAEILIKWVDDNGNAIKGHPVIGSRGFRMRMERFKELIHLPGRA